MLVQDENTDSQISSNLPTNDLLNYFEAIVMRWRMILKVTMAGFLISCIVALLLPKIYSSTALILPPQQDTSMIDLMLGQAGSVAADFAGGMLGVGSPADKFASILESERISDAIIDKYKLMQVYAKDYRLDMYKKLDKLVDIKAGKKDGIISITVEDEDPQRAADIANSYIDELGKLTNELNMKTGSDNKEFLEKRLAKARVDLNLAEDKLKLFQSKNKTIDLPEQAKASIVGVAELRSQLALQEVQLAALSRRFTENSQEVKDIKTSIAKLNAQIAKQEGMSHGSSIPTIESVPDLGQEYLRLMREFKTQETINDLLTKQYELAKLTAAKDVANIHVIQKAKPADKKIKPHRTLIVICTTFFSFFISILWIIFLVEIRKLPENELNRWKELRKLISIKSDNKK